MKKNFSFSFNSNFSVNGKRVFSNSASEKKDLTSQQEYWLNRFLRDYSGKVFIIILLFILLMFFVVIMAASSTQGTNTRNVQSSFEYSN